MRTDPILAPDHHRHERAMRSGLPHRPLIATPDDRPDSRVVLWVVIAVCAVGALAAVFCPDPVRDALLAVRHAFAR